MSEFSQSQIRAITLVGSLQVITLLIIVSGCMNAGYQVHPGSVDVYDSQVADALLQAKTFLETTKSSLTPKTEGLWSNLARAYDAAVPVYLAWHQAAKAREDQTQKKADLEERLMDLNQALTSFRAGGQNP